MNLFGNHQAGRSLNPENCGELIRVLVVDLLLSTQRDLPLTLTLDWSVGGDVILIDLQSGGEKL